MISMDKLYNKLWPYLVVLGVVLLSTLLAWAPFLFRQTHWLGLQIDRANFQYVYRNFDGPLYVVAAKTLYDPKSYAKVGFEYNLPAKYFAAHLPLYPFLIRIGAYMVGYLKSLVFINVLATAVLAMFFYYFIDKLKLTKKPLILTCVFLFLPRFLVVRTIGAPESLFMLLLLASFFFFEKEAYFWAGLFGGLAAMTKTPAILLFVAYTAVFLERYIKTKQISWKGLIGISLILWGILAVFLIYLKQYGDFFAYFHSGDNIHLVAPYSAFNFRQIWVGTAWLEDIIFYVALYAVSIFYLAKSRFRSFLYFSLIFFMAVLFIQHRDIARYSLPLWMFACIAFEKFFTSKKFLLALIIILPAIYMYAWNFLSYNVMSISNWAPFL